MTHFPTREEAIEAMRKAGRTKMQLMHFSDDAGYESNEELWRGIMDSALNALLKMLPDGAEYYNQLKAMEK